MLPGTGNGTSLSSFLGLSKPVDLVALQDSLLRFSDEFIASESRAIAQLEQDGSPLTRYSQVKFKVQFASDMLTLSTGSNPLSNLINMVIYVSTLKSSIQNYWLPLSNGVSELPVLRAVNDCEKDIWAIANQWLQPKQRAQLKQAIENWKHERPMSPHDSGSYASISLVNALTSEASVKNEGNNSLFSLLNLDPLASLDPATRELTDTRLFGERTLFVGKHLPQIMEWQLELLTLRTLQHPVIDQAIDNTTHLTKTSEKVGLTLSALPQTIARERKALLDAINAQTPQITELASQLEHTFGEGQKMADSVAALLTKAEAMTTQESVNNPKIKPIPRGGVDVDEYKELLVHLDSSLQHLNELSQVVLPILENREQMTSISELSLSLSQNAADTGQTLVDYAFKKLLILSLLIMLMIAGLMVLWTRLQHKKVRTPKDHD